MKEPVAGDFYRNGRQEWHVISVLGISVSVENAYGEERQITMGQLKFELTENNGTELVKGT